MLSEEEKKELLEMAASPVLREEFRRMRRNSEVFVSRHLDIDGLLEFLTAFGRFCPAKPPGRAEPPYARVLL